MRNAFQYRGLWVLLCMLIGAAGSTAMARDWFVAPGTAPGDGQRGKPFSDPWRALAAAGPGDSIHIAEGVYHGRYDRSAWEIDRPRVTVLGGYDREFRARDPWKHPSVFAFYRDYEGPSENNLLNGRDDHTGVVIDGLVFDGGGRNQYETRAPFGLRFGLTMVGPLVSLSSPEVVVRNCVLINSLSGAAELRGEGSRFENNIVINHQGPAMLSLREGTAGHKQPIVVRGNTFAFAYDAADPPMGRGGEKGIGVRVACAAQIENNVFAGCGNAGVLVFAKPERVAIDRNLFYLPLRGNVAVRDASRESLITDKNIEEIEDLGFKSCQGNRAADAALSGLKAQWIDGVTRQLLLNYATPPREGLSALRKQYGLDEPAPPANDQDRGPVAPLLGPADACAVRVQGDAGARPVELKVQFAADAVAAAPAKYTPVEWAELNLGPASLERKPVEVRVALGQERNGFILKEITADGYFGFDVYHPGGDKFPDQIHVYSIRHSAAHRQWQEAAKSTNAREAEDWYLIRGTCRLTGAGRQKATVQVDEIVPTVAPPKPRATPRPQGRDWFVRAGASGGDGSREKPFRDPFPAIEKAGPGDTIHVAGGDYFGKLKSGNWRLTTKFLSLMGGYDGEFKLRNPWTTPTRLVMAEQDPKERANNRHNGEFLRCMEACEGLVLDGFVFDGSTVNGYFDAASGGGLNLRDSPIGTMVQLMGADLAVRNCVFANASGIAVDLRGVAGTFENNVIVNTSGTSLMITADGPGPWLVRRNTFLYALDPTPRAGTGKSSAMGSHLVLRGRAAATIEWNIFAFADNYGIRATTPWAKLAVDANVFDANLYCHLSDANRVWLYDAVWQRRVDDAGLLTARQNLTALPAPAALPIDKEYADRTLPRLFELKTKYTREDWLRIGTAVGATVAPPEAVLAAAVEKPAAAPEKPKQKTLDELLAELDQAKKEREKAAEPAVAPKGAPYCPAYPWRKAVELVVDRDGAAAGARRETGGTPPPAGASPPGR